MKDLWQVTKTATAWESIGWDEGPFRIQNGTAIYQAVIYQCGPREGQTVLLSRLGEYQGVQSVGLKQVNRRVGPDTILEFLKPQT